MKYAFAGKIPTYYNYIKKYEYKITEVCYARTVKHLDNITEKDTIILLSGWWAKKWVKGFLKEVIKVYPTIKFEYLDGQFGESERKSLISERISNRFDILDL